MIRQASWIVVALGLLSGAARAQVVGDFRLDRKTYASPSGEVKLLVDPSAPLGDGPARYRCTRGEAELWAGERPYSLWDACVTEDGVVAGYAYGAGYRGGHEDSLTVVVLAPDGKARIEERSPREGSLSDLGAPDPLVRGIFLDPEGDRFVLRVDTASSSREESWWTYSLSSGEAGARIDPRAGVGGDARLVRVLEARTVPETGLSLALWMWSDRNAGQEGTVLTLLDREGHLAWRMDWPEDLGGADRWNLGDLVLDTGPGRFTVRSVAKDERVTFEVESVSGQREALEVREAVREPFSKEEALEPASELAHLELRHLGTIALGSTAPLPAVRDVIDFGLDGYGRIGFLRAGDRYAFVRVDADGANPTEIELPAGAEGEWRIYKLAWSRGERWIVTGSSNDALYAWWIDVAARTRTPIEGLTGPRVEALAATPDGGFVVMGTTSYESGYFTKDLVAFGPDGERRFALGGDQGDPKDPSSLFSAQGLTILPGGEIVVLDNARRMVQLFSASGEFLRAIDLEKVWGRELRYPTGIHPDREGGLVVHDFHGTPPIVRIGPDGAIRSSLIPRRADDGRFPLRGDVQIDPDGTPWTSDGHAFLRLDASGVVRGTIGAAPDVEVLGKIARLALGPGDRIYAADRRTGAVHVFRRDGTFESVCRPAPEDFEGDLSLPSLTVTDSDEVYLDKLHFAADGTRLGAESLPGSRYAFSAYAQRGSDRLWVCAGDQLLLMRPGQTPLRTIDRTPDGMWLRGLDEAGVAPDGSIALATSSHLGEGQPGIHLYTASGDPVRTLPQPEGMPSWAPFAYDGRRLAIGVQHQGQPGSVVFLDVQGKTLGSFTPPGETQCWVPHFASDGAELWLFDAETSRIERYAAL